MYALDAKAAKESDSIGGYLKDTGKYHGKFTRAEKLVSTNKGTHGVGFTFADESGQTTRFDIWTMNKDNEQLMGYKSLMAIMACLKVKNLKVSTAEVERYDYEAKERYVEDAEVFPDLMNKPIGLLLRNTEYEKMRDGQKTGENGWRLELYAPFESATEFTAGEIMDKKTKPEQLAKIEATLADRPLKKSSNSAPSASQQTSGQRSASRPAPNFSDMDDDIPF